MGTKTTTGYVACDYTDGDSLADVRHGDIRATETEADADQVTGDYQGVRFVDADGYLYVDQPARTRNIVTDSMCDACADGICQVHR